MIISTHLSSPSSPNFERQYCLPRSTVSRFYPSGTSPTQTTACGDHFDPTAMTATITTELANAKGGIEKWCGATIEVTSSDAVVQLTITDDNATGGSASGDVWVLDITPAAFDQSASSQGGTTGSPNGEVSIGWELTGTMTCLSDPS